MWTVRWCPRVCRSRGRGFNPYRRKVPSYYPIAAYEANTGQVLRVRNRAGNVHDGKASVACLEELFEQLEETLEHCQVLEMRMDGAFFREDVIDFLEVEGTEYAIKVPFYAWQVLSIIAFNLMLGLQACTTAERRSTNRKRRAIRPFQLIHRLRYRFINRAGLLVQPSGRATLDVGNNTMTRERFEIIEQALVA